MTNSNANLHIIKDGDVFHRGSDSRLQEYRRKWKENPERFTPGDFPVHLDIESTSICNLRCEFCAGTHASYPQGMMTYEVYRKIVDEGAENGLYSLKLNFRGEPLIHPEIAGFVKYAKSRGIADVFFNTNATLLDAEKRAELLSSDLDRLIISFEGYDKKTYETCRKGALFEATVENIRNFRKERDSQNLTAPLIRLQTVSILQDRNYMDSYHAFWEKYADEITLIDIRDENADYKDLQCSGWSCPYPWLRLCVTWNGEILTCPFVNKDESAYSSFRNLGTFPETSIKGAWQSQNMETIRNAHKTGTSGSIEPCMHCSYRGTEILNRNKAECSLKKD